MILFYVNGTENMHKFMDVVLIPEKMNIPEKFLVNSGVSIAAVVKALNALGVSPRDLISIFQALKAAGALQAELEII